MDTQKQIDQQLIEQAKHNIADTIGRFIQLKQRGREFVACCPFHDEKTPSFSVNPAKEFYHCFGCGASGDAIGFVMEYQGLEFPEAVERILGSLPHPDNAIATGKKPLKPSVWRAIRNVPANAPQPAFNHYRLGKPSDCWPYHDADGSLIGYVCRFAITKPDGSVGKETVPLCWAVNTDTAKQEWRWLSFTVPRQLFGLELLAARPEAKVLVVEGEKTAVAARALFGGFVVISWPGGGKAVEHADWKPLHGRNITLWPDWDWKTYRHPHAKAGDIMPVEEQPGVIAMRQAFDQLKAHCQSIRFVPPHKDSPDAWDLADPSWSTSFNPQAYAKESVIEAAHFFSGIAPDQASDNNAQKLKASDIFGQPVDLFGVSQPPALPLDVLPEAMRAYVADQSELLGCDHSIIGITSLVSAAACITDEITIQPKRYDYMWKESARLWVAVVGDPSTRKSPAIGKAVRCVKSMDMKMAEQNGTNYAEWKHQHDQWKDAKKAAKGQDPLPEPKQPPVKRLIVEDITVEALSEVLKDNPRGVLCLQDELTGWFASMDAYRGGGKAMGKDRAHWLEAYNGGGRSIDRVTRGSVIVPNWSACMIGGIQPDMMRRVSNSMGNDGLLQRFMVICASPSKTGPDRTPNVRALEEYRELFRQMEAINGSSDPVKMTEGAHKARERITSYSVRMIDAFGSPHIGAWLGKWDGLFARLSLLYHVVDCASRRVYPTTELVSQENAERVERLMCGTLLHHAIHFYSEIIDSHERQENQRQLARLILAKRMDRLTKRDITLLWKASRRMEWWEIRSVIDGLCSMDWLMPDAMSIDTDGKPKAWMVNPVVHEMFTGHAEREMRRRQEAAAMLRELKEAYQ